MDYSLTILLSLLALGGLTILAVVAGHYRDIHPRIRPVKHGAADCDRCGCVPGELYIVVVSHDDGPRGGLSIYDRHIVLCRRCAEALTFKIDCAVELCELATWEVES